MQFPTLPQSWPLPECWIPAQQWHWWVDHNSSGYSRWGPSCRPSGPRAKVVVNQAPSGEPKKGKSWSVEVLGLGLIKLQLRFWLVVFSHPSEKYESQLGWLFPIYGKIKNVPNHQPGFHGLNPTYNYREHQIGSCCSWDMWLKSSVHTAEDFVLAIVTAQNGAMAWLITSQEQIVAAWHAYSLMTVYIGIWLLFDHIHLRSLV